MLLAEVEQLTPDDPVRVLQILLPLLAVAAGAVLLLWVVRRMRAEKRRMELHTLAEGLGLQPATDEDNRRRRRQLYAFALLRPAQATRKEIRNRCVGRIGDAQVEVFDVHRTMNTRANEDNEPEHLPAGELHANRPDSVVDSDETAVLVSRDGLSLPPLLLAPDSSMKRFLDGRRSEERLDEFDDHNTLDALDPQRAEALFTGELRNLLSRNRDLTIEARGSQVLVYRESRVLKPAQLRSLVDEALWIAEQMHEANSSERG